MGKHNSGANAGHWTVSSWEERNVELSQTHEERDSLASWEMWALLLIDLGSPLASPGGPLVPCDSCSRKGEGHLHVCVCVCAHAPGSAWAVWSLLLPQGHHSIPTPDETTGVQFLALPKQLCELGQYAQPLCVSILVCDTGWEHQPFGLMCKHRQNLAEAG